MNLLTQNQRIFFISKKIKEGGLYMFPRFGFTAYETKNFSSSVDINTNPFTKSLDKEQFEVKSIDDDWCRGNFHRGANCPDFYLRKSDLSTRDMIEIIFLLIVAWLPLVIYNVFTKADRSKLKRVDLDEKLIPTKESYFSKEDFENAMEHYDKYTMLVNFRITDEDLESTPTPPPEKNLDEPLLWKTEHWKWFFEDEELLQ